MQKMQRLFVWSAAVGLLISAAIIAAQFMHVTVRFIRQTLLNDLYGLAIPVFWSTLTFITLQVGNKFARRSASKRLTELLGVKPTDTGESGVIVLQSDDIHQRLHPDNSSDASITGDFRGFKARKWVNSNDSQGRNAWASARR